MKNVPVQLLQNNNFRYSTLDVMQTRVFKVTQKFGDSLVGYIIFSIITDR